MTIKPFPETNLEKLSQVMIDKAMTVPKEKAGAVFGKLDYATMQQVDRCLALFLGIAK
ncbi:type II toxin-antitoxin system PemK/MazF family toxin [Photorhabdus khanii]|uniref:type II toxin-antitoxin system PemK/MazF family toxin n=1 Tax=Photorhabdus khanii TaxID=1004150 RepID=UPI0009E07606|nr:type II toxin-antitoxin system PemK/MazF family toxin [Photorhabdus khanii]